MIGMKLYPGRCLASMSSSLPCIRCLTDTNSKADYPGKYTKPKKSEELGNWVTRSSEEERLPVHT